MVKKWIKPKGKPAVLVDEEEIPNVMVKKKSKKTQKKEDE